MSFTQAQIKDMLRDIQTKLVYIKDKLDGPTPEELEYANVADEKNVSTNDPNISKEEKRRIFLERMRIGREKAKAKRGENV